MGEVVSLDEFRERRDIVAREMNEANQNAAGVFAGIPVVVVASPGISLTFNGEQVAVAACPYCAPDELCAMHSPTSGDLSARIYFRPPGVDC